MGRIVIGAAVAAVAMFVIGFLFFATPLAGIASGDLDNAQAAEVQRTLAANLPSTGTYFVPNADTAEQTVMYAQGPIATIHYNTEGFPALDMGAMLLGLVLNFLVALLIGAALIGIDRRVPDFGSRARTVAIIAVAASAFVHLGQPIYYHHGWSYFIYLFIADAAALAVAGLIIARWFLPRQVRAPADAPTEV